ncbi:hypothetical protein BGZ96_011495 [Linnemannia gamsii]|uniref:Histone chaperone domain-containing protein n=1 Tax=Linnemannia gamsii TaxID=64522 RepID=A0ABQ7KC84_9FUNG|nr:hypothetical protein BGZ96_011495 [Linnemannia gamsii]
MSQCVIDFDTCHQICFPEEHISEEPGSTVPAAPGGAPPATPGNGPQKHKDVTDLGQTDDDDHDEDGDEDQEENEASGIAVGVEVDADGKKVLPAKSMRKGKVAAKEAVGLTLTPEEINRLQASYTDDTTDEDIIAAPKGGEDAAEFDDDPSDY